MPLGHSWRWYQGCQEHDGCSASGVNGDKGLYK